MPLRLIVSALSVTLVLAACGQHKTPLSPAEALAVQRTQPETGNGQSKGPDGKPCTALPEGAPVLRPIHEVQGTTDASPYVGQGVTVRGVVTADLQSTLQGFFVQDQNAGGPKNASSGIFVYTAPKPWDVRPGDLVQLSGTVSEFRTVTQIAEVTRLAKCASGEKLTPTTVTLPLENANAWERYEGMLVSTKGVVTDLFKLGRGGSVTIADERLTTFTQANAPSVTGYAAHLTEVARRSIIIDDGSLGQNPDPVRFARNGQVLSATNPLRGGDSASVSGVVTFSWDGWNGTRDAYRIHASQADFAGKERPSAPTDAQLGHPGLRVASMNVLNFFNGSGSGGGFPTSRGAENPAELARQTDKIVSALAGLDADVVGLLEIENDFDTSTPAIRTLVEALNARLGEGTYAYVNPHGKVGTDEIAVALIYRPARVTPVGPLARLTAAFHPDYIDTRNRVTIAQSFYDRTSGGVFTVAEAHLKSKGSSCGSGDDDVASGQGNCNLTRLRAAKVMVNWLSSQPTGIADSDVIIMGDLNAYAMEDPIRAIEAGADGAAGTGDDFVNLFAKTSYSYSFDGQWGSLDHALASGSLKAQVTGAAKWHINADEAPVLDYNLNFKSPGQRVSLYAPDAFRSSDHDPLVIGLSLTRDPLPMPAPVFSVDTPTAVFSGQPYTLTVSGVTLAPGATLQAAEVDWGNGDGFVQLSATGSGFSGTLASAPGTHFQLRVRLTDSNGKSSVEIRDVTVKPAPLGKLVISQVYGGGGNSGAHYTHDFIEVFNAGQVAVNLKNHSVQYASASGTSWQLTRLASSDLNLAPGQYFLVQQAAGTGGTTPLPTPDAIGTIAMSASSGKVALVSNDVALSAAGSFANVLDLVGFGFANAYEETATPALTNTTAALRKNAGCIDTDNNAADFSTGVPGPRNTAAALNVCPSQ